MRRVCCPACVVGQLLVWLRGSRVPFLLSATKHTRSHHVSVWAGWGQLSWKYAHRALRRDWPYLPMVGVTVSGRKCLTFASRARPRLGGSQPRAAVRASCCVGLRGSLPPPLSSMRPCTRCHITFLCALGGVCFLGNKGLEPPAGISIAFSMASVPYQEKTWPRLCRGCGPAGVGHDRGSFLGNPFAWLRGPRLLSAISATRNTGSHH